MALARLSHRCIRLQPRAGGGGGHGLGPRCGQLRGLADRCVWTVARGGRMRCFWRRPTMRRTPRRLRKSTPPPAPSPRPQNGCSRRKRKVPRSARLTNGVWGIAAGRLAVPGRAWAARRSCEDLPLALTSQMYLQAFASNLIAAAQRLLPLGQTEGQAILRRVAGLCPRHRRRDARRRPGRPQRHRLSARTSPR